MASPLIFAQSVVSPQNWGGVSAAATDAKILSGVSHPERTAARARPSSRPVTRRTDELSHKPGIFCSY
ncbi:MAG: hypothetical protein JRL30_12160 [Deltaproteobacteria bacterium]|nr:hypothetical protein [Deltaproteobacteria bacterium]